jgi:hypothetical protein
VRLVAAFTDLPAGGQEITRVVFGMMRFSRRRNMKWTEKLSQLVFSLEYEIQEISRYLKTHV